MHHTCRGLPHPVRSTGPAKFSRARRQVRPFDDAHTEVAPNDHWSILDRLIRTDPREVGCGETAEILHIFAEVATADPAEAARRFRGIQVHLDACTLDLKGLLAVLSAVDTERPAPRTDSPGRHTIHIGHIRDHRSDSSPSHWRHRRPSRARHHGPS